MQKMEVKNSSSFFADIFIIKFKKDMKSLPQCQVKNSITEIEMLRLPKYSCHAITVDFIFALLYPFYCSDFMV